MCPPSPGRRQSGGPWAAVMDALRAGGYRGAVGLECRPTGPAEAALRRCVEVLGAVRVSW